MKAVIYARYSSDNQREESIEGQVRECLAFAERKGHTVIKTYADRALSGRKAENRPEFMQMIANSARGEFDAVIVWKIDRFSRNKYDSTRYKHTLYKNNVTLISATEPIDDTAEGQLMESIFEGFAEYYSKDLAQKTTRGMTENVLKGKFNGGPLIFGYVIDNDRKFQIDPDTAPVVEDIFNRYANGESIRSIIDDLQSKGLDNRGKPFSYNFINRMLKNRRYIGEYVFKDIVNTEAIPPIITEELFEKCQRRLEANKYKPASFRKVEDKYFLTGKIFCGCCGDTMSGVSGTGRNEIYRYYQCMTSKKHRCSKKIVQKDLIENVVTSAAMSVFKDKELIDRISDACYSLQNTESAELPALRKQLKQVNKEIDNVMNAIKAGIVTKTTKSTLENLEQEQEKLETAISLEKIRRPVISKEHIKAWLMKFSRTDLSNQEQKQRLIDVFVNSVHVYEDRVVVLLNYKDGEKCIHYSDSGGDEKKPDTPQECSTLVACGDPYGNRKWRVAFSNFLKIAENLVK